MTRQLLNYVIDVLSALVLVGSLVSGLVVRFVLPAGSGGSALWSYTRHGWGDIHFWIAVAAMVLVCLHLALHWNWVCTMTRRAMWLPPRRAPGGSRWMQNAVGVAILVLAIGVCTGLVHVARSSVTTAAGHGGGERRGWGQTPESRESHTATFGGAEIRGSMTLADAARAMGRSTDELIVALKLPSSTPATEQLGRLRQKHGFTMSQVRTAFDQPVPK